MTAPTPRRRYTNREFIGRTLFFAALTGLGVWIFIGASAVGTQGIAIVVSLVLVSALSIMQAAVLQYVYAGLIAAGIAGLLAWQGFDEYLLATVAGVAVGVVNGHLGRVSRERLEREIRDDAPDADG